MKFFSLFTLMVIILAGVVFTASARDEQYEALQLKNLKIDGVLDEWAEWIPENIIALEAVFGGEPPDDPDDFTGSVMIAWNEDDSSRIYFAVKIIDDEIQDINPANTNHWQDDSMEFIFDSNNDGSAQQFTLDANGKDLSASATGDNTTYVVSVNDDKVIFEVAIEPAAGFKAGVGDAIGLALSYNDSEDGARQDQIRWIANENAWGGASNQGDLVFSAQIMAAAPVEPQDKLTATWGSLKLH